MSTEKPVDTPVADTKAPAKAYISTEEIKKHTSRDDLWMVINGKVYDVTPFVDEHPYVC